MSIICSGSLAHRHRNKYISPPSTCTATRQLINTGVCWVTCKKDTSGTPTPCGRRPCLALIRIQKFWEHQLWVLAGRCGVVGGRDGEEKGVGRGWRPVLSLHTGSSFPTGKQQPAPHVLVSDMTNQTKPGCVKLWPAHSDIQQPSSTPSHPPARIP